MHVCVRVCEGDLCFFHLPRRFRAAPTFSSECINLNAFDKKTTPLMLSLLRVPFRGYPDGGLSRLSIFDETYRLLGGQGKLSESPQMLNIYDLALTD